MRRNPPIGTLGLGFIYSLFAILSLFFVEYKIKEAKGMKLEDMEI